MKTSDFQFHHDAVLPVAANSPNSADNNQGKANAHKSVSDRQGDRVVRHKERLENIEPAGLPGSGAPAAAELVRLRNVAGGVCQIRRNAGRQNGGAQCSEHEPELLGSHPHDGDDHESKLTLFRVVFSDHSAMLIDATNKEHASELGQAWSRHWDRLDPRRVVNVTKL